MRPGFAGVDNDLYYNPKCMMLFGDAKESMTKLFAELKTELEQIKKDIVDGKLKVESEASPKA